MEGLCFSIINMNIKSSSLYDSQIISRSKFWHMNFCIRFCLVEKSAFWVFSYIFLTMFIKELELITLLWKCLLVNFQHLLKLLVSHGQVCFCLFFFSSIFFKFYFIFKLYIIVLVLPNIKMNPPQVYTRLEKWQLSLTSDFSGDMAVLLWKNSWILVSVPYKYSSFLKSFKSSLKVADTVNRSCETLEMAHLLY